MPREFPVGSMQGHLFQGKVDAILGSNTYGGGLPVGDLSIWDFLLSQQASRGIGGHLLEVGVWHGVGIATMGLSRKDPEQMIGVDVRFWDAEIERTFQQVFGADKPTLVRINMDSRAARKKATLRQNYGEFRYVHIDGEHSYDAVLSDLELAADLLHEFGVVAVDDFFSLASACVTHAVFDFLAANRHRLRMFLAGFNKAYLTTPRALGMYRQACHEKLGGFCEQHYDVKTTVGNMSHSTELDYLTIFPRHKHYRYLEIGRYID